MLISNSRKANVQAVVNNKYWYTTGQ